jgi:hypothetical protein
MNTDTHSFWEPQFRPAPKTHLEPLCKPLHVVFLRKRDTTARMIRTRNESHVGMTDFLSNLASSTSSFARACRQPVGDNHMKALRKNAFTTKSALHSSNVSPCSN